MPTGAKYAVLSKNVNCAGQRKARLQRQFGLKTTGHASAGWFAEAH